MKFYSEKLDKIFDTEEALTKAETEAVEAENKKKAESAKRKEDADKVEKAFKTRNEVRRTYNTAVLNLRKKYNEDLLKLKAEFDKAVEVEKQMLQEAEANYDKELKDFIANHKQYHLTLTDGNNVTTISSDQTNTKTKSLIDELFSTQNFWREYWKDFSSLFNI